MYNGQAFYYFKDTFNYKIRFSRISETGTIDNLFWSAPNYQCYFTNVQVYMNIVVCKYLWNFYGQALMSNVTVASLIGYFSIGISFYNQYFQKNKRSW